MLHKIVYIITIILFLACSSKSTSIKTISDMNEELTMVVGTYTTGSIKGIYTYRFNQSTGEAFFLSEAAITNPSYLTISSDNKYVFAVSELNNGKESVTSFGLNKEKGILKPINSQPAMGGDPCYIISNDKYIITANYTGGSISVFPVKKDGYILPATDIISFEGTGPVSGRQDTPHLHCVAFTPDGKYLLANDLGTDHIYRLNINDLADTDTENTSLHLDNIYRFKIEPGSGPRHLTFSPNGKFAYLINELAGTVLAFQYNDGILNEIQSIDSDTVAAGGSADIHVSPDGKFLYASNRLKADGLAIFKINETNGLLSKVGYQLTGGHPRNFIITPNGKYLLVACRDKSAIEVYLRDLETGILTNLNKEIKLDKPVCIKFAF